MEEEEFLGVVVVAILVGLVIAGMVLREIFDWELRSTCFAGVYLFVACSVEL